MRFTEEQEQAITMRPKNLLVSAAAGSGKTAVLVERVLRRLVDREDPLDVDEILVVTFTEAAAEEMKSRIRKALEEHVSRHPDDGRLRRQLLLLDRADISTLHSFCLRTIRQYFHKLGLDPTFVILDEHEAELIKAEVIEELLEDRYASLPDGLAGEENGQAAVEQATSDSRNGEDFLRLVEWYGGKGGDESLSSLILRLHDFTMSLPDPEDWLDRALRMFEAGREQDLRDTEWGKALIEHAIFDVKTAIEWISRAVSEAEKPAGPAVYAAALRDDLRNLENLLRTFKTRPWDEVAAALHEFEFPGLPRRPRGDDAGAAERVRGYRDRAKNLIRSLKNSVLSRPSCDLKGELQLVARLMRVLADLVIEFDRRYREAKSRRQGLDFSDLERYCLELLRSEPEGEAVRSRYREIFVDEYQDINPIQDAIIQLISAGSPDRKLFMVGDYRQSIYAFRLAEPGIFLSKYKRFPRTLLPDGAELLATLSTNFRSRKEILDAVNYVFRRIMLEGVTGVAYGAEEELRPGRTMKTAVPDSNGQADRDDRARCGSQTGCGDHPGYDVRAGYDDQVASDDQAGYHDQAVHDDQTGYHDQAGCRDQADYSVELHLIERNPVQREGSVLEAGQNAGEEMGSTRAQTPGEDGEASRDRAGGAKTGGGEAVRDGSRAGSEEDAGNGEDAGDDFDAEDLEALEKEALVVAAKIREITSSTGLTGLRIWDERLKDYRPCRFRDVVVLMRATRNRCEAVLGILRRAGIPVYADVETGYFAAREVEVVLSLLSVIDNPLQDIPLASVLRSPIVGLSGEEMAKIRLTAPDGRFLYAVEKTARTRELGDLSRKVQSFLANLDRWRTMARRMPLADLIWRLLSETRYLDYVSGIPGGVQRRANLLALCDRAREFDSFRRRGLFRFLRFIRRLEESQGDLGQARALGEQENVVRVLSVHKAKGLEFPVVFVMDLGRRFDFKDIRQDVLYHRRLGLGPVFVDAEAGIKYPTVAHAALSGAIVRESMAEEMRILYVAMTRAREKLFLVGSTRDLAGNLERWKEQGISPSSVASAGTYLDWLAPCIFGCTSVTSRGLSEGGKRLQPGDSPLRCTGATSEVLDQGKQGREAGVEAVGSADSPRAHSSSEVSGRELGPEPASSTDVSLSGGWRSSIWKVQCWGTSCFPLPDRPLEVARVGTQPEIAWEKLKRLELPDSPPDPEILGEVERRMDWRYPLLHLTEIPGKITVGELAERLDSEDEDGWMHALRMPLRWKLPRGPGAGTSGVSRAGGGGELCAGSAAENTGELKPAADRMGMSEQGSSPAVSGGPEVQSPAITRGIAVHRLLAHIDLGLEPDESTLSAEIGRLVQNGILTADEASLIDKAMVLDFLRSPVGCFLRERRHKVKREVPFTMRLPASLFSKDPASSAYATLKAEGSEASVDGYDGVLPQVQPVNDATRGREELPDGSDYVVVQGTIDAVVVGDGGLEIIDYKTDRVSPEGIGALVEHYTGQVSWYAFAAETILRRPVTRARVVFLHAREERDVPFRKFLGQVFASLSQAGDSTSESCAPGDMRRFSKQTLPLERPGD